MAIASLVLAGLGGAVSAYGAIQSGNAQAAASRYQAQVAENQARFEAQRGQVEEQTNRMQNNALLAKQRVGLAANGVDINTGSAIDVQASGQLIGELDALTIRSNTQGRVAALRAQSQLSTMESKQAKLAGYIGAAGNILGTASSVAGKWSSFKSGGLV